MNTLTINIFHARNIVKTFEQDFDKLPAHVQHFVAEYGLRQILNDAASSQKKHEAKDVVAAAEAKFNDLKQGILKAARASDPFGKWCRGQLIVALQKKGLTAKNAAAHLKKCGNSYAEQVGKLYGEQAPRVFKMHKDQWKALQADDLDLDLELDEGE